MTDPYSRPRTSSITPILSGAALVVAGYLVLDRVGVFDPAPRGEPRVVVARGDLTQFEKTTTKIFEENAPSVVHITLQTKRGVFNQDTGTGSGFVWDEQGHIVTNHHVIEAHGAAQDRIQVRFADRREFTAYVVHSEPQRDIAVLRLADPPRNLRPVPIGTSNDLKVGQFVLAIGNPFGLDLTLTSGLVSALDRSIQTRRGVALHNLIQTDAAINPGNSGGPLFDSAGRLIGMNTAIFSQTGNSIGIGFAVPVDVINEVVPRLIEKKSAPRAVLGVYLHTESVRLPRGIGYAYAVPITNITPGYGAEEAGVGPTLFDRSGRMVIGGDAIVAIDDKVVESASEVMKVLSSYKPGSVAKVALARFGRGAEGYEPRIEKVEIKLKGFAARNR